MHAARNKNNNITGDEIVVQLMGIVTCLQIAETVSIKLYGCFLCHLFYVFVPQPTYLPCKMGQVCQLPD